MPKIPESKKYLADLNEEQIKAVTFGKGPLLIVAGAGTGKTTVITRRVAYLIDQKNLKPEEILAVTFTDKAAQEMEERVDKLLPYGYLDLWISTFHSFCQRVLQEYGLDIGLPTNFRVLDPTSAWLLIRKNLDRFNLDYYKPLGNPTKFIHALIEHFARCKDQGIYPEDYLGYAKNLEKRSSEEIDETEIKRIKEIAKAYKTYQEILLENSALDFGDLINYTLKLFKERPRILKKYRDQFKYILVDEFQDTNWAQYELVKLLAEPKKNLTVCADDDQCLPGNALIETPYRKKSIKDIKPGDEVLSGVGKAHIGISKVKRVFKRKKDAWLLTIRTKNGYKVQVTDNHKMFCYVPDRSKGKYHYVYLMYRKDLGWRMGVTNDLAVRLRLERSADFILPLRAFPTDEEARYYETLWSLKYGIPTSCFKTRKRTVIKDKLLAKLYNDLNVSENIKKLVKDLNVDLNYPHFYLNAVTRGRSRRVMINVNMCARRYRSKDLVRNKNREFMLSPWIKHTLTLETSDKTTINRLKKAGIKLKKAKKGWIFRVESDNLKEIGEIAEKLQKLTDGIIKTKSYIGRIGYITKAAVVLPAKNLVEGLYLPVKKGKEIVYDEIIEIKKEKKKLTVYDLEIEKTHNFIANGIVVHNSIYRWRGASFNNVLRFKEDYPHSKEVILVKNYRSTQDILDLAYKFIQLNNPNRLEYQLNQVKELSEQAKKIGVDLNKFKHISKKLIAQNKGKGTIEHLHFKTSEEEVRGVVDKIEELYQNKLAESFSDFAILVRSNNAAVPFSKELERRGIPYQFLASKGLYLQPPILDIIAYLKLLDNYHESPAVFRILTSPIFDIPYEEIVAITNTSRKKAQSLYETLKEIEKLDESISEKTKKKIDNFLELLQKHSRIAESKNVSSVFISFLNDSGYLAKLVKENKHKELNFLQQFYKKIKEFEESQTEPTLKNFMELLDMEFEAGETGGLEFDIEEGPETVKIMTIHSAKGLEFKYVFLVNLVDKRFPTTERKDPIQIPDELIKDILPLGDIHLQEERRLFYVGMTRAKRGVFFTSAQDYGGLKKKKLSRFLYELGIEKKIAPVEQKELFSPPKIAVIKSKTKLPLPPYFSYTQLAAFEKCPLQYKFAHILKIPRAGSATLSFGKTMHNTLLRFVKESIEKGRLSLKRLYEIYDEEWIDEWYESKSHKEKYYQLGKNSLKMFFERFREKSSKIKEIKGILALELPFNLKVKDYTIKGKIDRIDELKDGTIEIIDYKTGKAKEKLNKEEKEQLLIYQLAAEEVLKLQPQKLTYYYLDTGDELSFEPIKEKEEFKEKILQEIEKIQNSEFEPTPGFHCKFCDYKHICEFRKL